MIARFSILLPFDFVRPHDEELRAWTFDRGGYEVTVRAPVQSAARAAGIAHKDVRASELRVLARPADTQVPAQHVFLNGKTVCIADLLQVLFRKGEFERNEVVIRERGNIVDPAFALAFEIANEFLQRFRERTGAFGVRRLLEERGLAVVEYLDDNEQPLPPDPSKFRGTAFHYQHQSFNPLTMEIWNSIRNPDDRARQLVWDGLLLDAVSLLPDVGPAIVLAATCLETLVAEALDLLVRQTSIPESLWTWLTDRGDFRKEPSVLEQYDVLWKAVTGASLKAESELWEALRNLRDARNSFVHEGQPMVGGRALSVADARRLLEKAESIVQWVERFLPPNVRRPRVTTKVNLAVKKMDVGPAAVLLAQSATVHTGAGSRELKAGQDD